MPTGLILTTAPKILNDCRAALKPCFSLLCEELLQTVEYVCECRAVEAA